MNNLDMPEYWGDMPFPADRWGRCPIRGDAVKIAHETLLEPAESLGLTATLIVDRLVEARILPDELKCERMRVIPPLVECSTCGVVRTHSKLCREDADDLPE